MNGNGTRAVVYARVSSDDRGNDGRNLQGQLEMCREYALKQGWHVVADLAEDDKGASGAALELPELKKARDMARAKNFDAKRGLIEALDVRVTLVVEDDQQLIYAECLLDEDTFLTSITIQGIVLPLWHRCTASREAGLWQSWAGGCWSGTRGTVAIFPGARPPTPMPSGWQR
jgi:hypothetical protein